MGYAVLYLITKGAAMADSIEITVRDETYGVDVHPREGNHRRFTVGSIPLSCTVSRSGKPECADLHFSVRADIRVDIPDQELYTPSEFEASLGDHEMHGHAHFVIAQWARQSAVVAEG